MLFISQKFRNPRGPSARGRPKPARHTLPWHQLPTPSPPGTALLFELLQSNVSSSAASLHLPLALLPGRPTPPQAPAPARVDQRLGLRGGFGTALDRVARAEGATEETQT